MSMPDSALDFLRSLIRESRIRYRLRTTVTECLSLPADVVIDVTELPAERKTVITIISASGIQKYTLSKALVDVSEADLCLLRPRLQK